MTEDCCLIIFVKNPELGRVKSRLSREVGDSAALAVYLKLISMIRKTCEPLPFHKMVFYDAYIDHEDQWDDRYFDKRKQTEGSIGERMNAAISIALDDGFKRVCLIGSDIPDISEEILNRAFEGLTENDVVLGPAADGGYYLIGMTRRHPQLFALKQWSTSSVFQETRRLIDTNGLTCGLLRELKDIDRRADLDDRFHGLM